MNATIREQTILLARDTVAAEADNRGPVLSLAAGLLAEHAEVLAGRDKIRDLEDATQRSAARAIAREQEHVADLAAARGITARLRAAILAGYLDVTQARAAEVALAVVSTDDGETDVCARQLAAAFLALAETHRQTRAQIDALRAGLAVPP